MRPFAQTEPFIFEVPMMRLALLRRRPRGEAYRGGHNNLFSTFSESEPHQLQAADALLQNPRPRPVAGASSTATPGRDKASAAEGRGPEDRCLLSETVITFDDLPAGTHEVSDQ